MLNFIVKNKNEVLKLKFIGNNNDNTDCEYEVPVYFLIFN